MTDIKAWVDEHRAIHAAATEAWEHDASEDGGNFWAGGGRSDFHLTVEDAAFCVDAHNVTVPTALSMIEAVLAVHQPHPSNPLRCAAEYELRPCPTEGAIMDALEG